MRFLLRHKIAVTLLLLIAGGIGGGVWYLTRPPKPEYITAQAKRGDLVQTVEAVGEVTSEKDLELKFPVSGVVARVSVTEGDRVTAGQLLSELKAGSLAAAVDSARAKLLSAQADLRTLQEGTRPEDIAIAQAELENKRAALALARTTLQSAETTLERSEQKLRVLRDEAATSLAGTVATAGTTIVQELSDVRTSLRTVEDVLESTDVQDIVVKENPAGYKLLIRDQRSAVAAVELALKDAQFADYEEALQALGEARDAAAQAARVMSQVYDFVAGLPTSTYFTVSDREDSKSTLGTEKADVASSLSSLEAELKEFRDASAAYATQITAEEATVASAQGTRDKALTDIQTYETAVRISEAQLQLKKAGSRQSDIDAAAARVQQARADLQKAIADYEDTKLLAPIDGTITKVNLKPGEFTPGQFTATEPAITLLGASPFRVEIYVAEVDIPKVRIGQSGAIVLDAFPGISYKLRVSEIDPAATIRDGVPKYLVTLDFVYPHEEFKIGMTGDTDIFTASAEDVVMIPARAVVEDEEGRPAVRILKGDGMIERRHVETGLEGINDIEIMSGVSDGETVIVLQK